MKRRFLTLVTTLLLLISVGLPTWLQTPSSAFAAASIYVVSSSPVRVGDTISVAIYTNTGGQSANSWDAHLSYPASLLSDVRGSTTGSVCNIWITQPDPNGGGADISCGKSGGFTGTGLLATIYLSATNPGTASMALSGCSVLANDGSGTDITGGCSGTSVTINPQSSTPTPPPFTTPPKTPTPSLLPSNTPKPVTTPKPPATPGAIGSQSTPAPTGPAVPSDKGQLPQATATPTPPPVSALPKTPTPATGTGTASATPDTSTQKRTISSAFKDVFTSFGELKGTTDFTGLFALLLAMIPFLALCCAILFFIYRLFSLERMRKRGLDRLFEIELSELAALEGKMDLLAEKGTKGREQYREEFRLAKENILRQIHPDYGQPVEAKAATQAPKE